MAAGLLILKHTEALSDEALIRTWFCNPYYQYFCDAIHFQPQPPVYPSTMGRWRQNLGERGRIFTGHYLKKRRSNEGAGCSKHGPCLHRLDGDENSNNMANR